MSGGIKMSEDPELYPYITSELIQKRIIQECYNKEDESVFIGLMCEHGKYRNDYCEPCGRINGG